MESNPQDIVPFDLQRMFFGDMSVLFLAEIAFRTVVVYLFALALVRLVSQRAIGQLSVVEFLLVIALGSAVGDAMFYPEVPLIHAFAVIAIVVGLDSLIDRLVVRSELAERLIEGVPRQVIADGVIAVDELDAAQLNQEMLFELLREKGVGHLGEVRAAYLEQRGSLTLARAPRHAVRAGLPVMPPMDLWQPPTLGPGRAEAGTYGCARCGTTETLHREGELGPCPHCGHGVWMVIEPDRLISRVD